MEYCLSSFLPAILLLVSISSGETSSVNMCQNKAMFSGEDMLKLNVIRPSTPSPITNTSVTCSCSININKLVPSLKKVAVRFARDTKPVSSCNKSSYDEVTLNVYSATGTIAHTYSLQDEELEESYEDFATMTFQVMIHLICGSNYTMRLVKYKQTNVGASFSAVKCSFSQTVDTSPVMTISPATSALEPTGASKNDTSTAYSSKERSSADSFPTPIGLIVGVVVGVSAGLLILGAIILAVFIFRGRRAKPQPLTYANHNAPIENSYDPPMSGVPIFYEDASSSNQLQPSALYDNQNAATDSLTTETNQSYNSVQGIDNSAFPPNFAEYNSGRATSEEVDRFAQETHSVDDTDITVIDNDLYEK